MLRSPTDENKFGEIWHLSALGGSGYYQWSIIDDKVAQITASGLLRSLDVGSTTITVRDSLNQRNSHSIKVEVALIASFGWLEDHLEIRKGVESSLLNLIAYDKTGRKFTNCTSVDANFELKGVGIVALIP